MNSKINESLIRQYAILENPWNDGWYVSMEDDYPALCRLLRERGLLNPLPELVWEAD